MSDTTEMVRLIRFASERLGKEPVSNPSLGVSIGLAVATLNMVAACMEPETEPYARALKRVRDLIDIDSPYVRTDELLEVLEGAP